MKALQKAVTEKHYNCAPLLSREYRQVSVKPFLVIIASFFRAVSPFCTSACFESRVFIETDSGYPRDAEVTLFTLANPEHSLRFNTHWSAPPVSALARSGGSRKMSQSPVSRNSNIERRMDRPRAVVGVIRGVA